MGLKGPGRAEISLVHLKYFCRDLSSTPTIQPLNEMSAMNNKSFRCHLRKIILISMRLTDLRSVGGKMNIIMRL